MTSKTKSQSPKTTFKDFVKVTGAELNNAGHNVPHSTLLEAMSRAMNARDWNKFCLQLGMKSPQAVSASALVQEEAQPKPFPVNYPQVFYPSVAQTFIARLSETVKFGPMPVIRTMEGLESLYKAWLETPGAGIQVTLREEGSSAGSEVSALWNPVSGAIHGAPLTIGRKVMQSHVFGPRFEQLVNLMSDSSGLKLDVYSQHELCKWIEAFMEERLVDQFTAFGLPYGVGPRVSAVLRSDDQRYKAEFDARPYLYGATDEELREIWGAGLSGGYCTEDIALTVHTLVPDDAMNDVFSYVDAAYNHTDIGTECTVNGRMFGAWLKSQRPLLHAQLLCEQEGVLFTTDEEGLISYAYGQHKVEGFATKDAAVMAAAEALGTELGYSHYD